LAIAVAAPAGAAPVTLRMATIAPEGTAWAQEIRALNRDVEVATRGRVRFKWYLGAVAGDELTVLERIHKGQLDGEAGVTFCTRLGPALRVMYLVGLFQSREEEAFILERLRSVVGLQFRARGFVNLGLGSGFGESILFTRLPVASLDDLRHTRLWIWGLDDVTLPTLEEMGIPMVGTDISAAARAYAERRIDGFLSVPTGALAFQWSAMTHYFTALPVSFLPGCIAVTASSFDALPAEDQQAVQRAFSSMIERFNGISQLQSRQLLGGLFEKQGLHRLPPSEGFASEFYAAARAAREHLGSRLVPTALYETVRGWLTEMRSARGAP
jgi:TRAP-type C4-dicarboxylate transport system substrate-binding protein